MRDTAGRDSGPIDFADLAAALLARADSLVPSWLPGGKRVGPEYVCGDLSGGEGGSCSVNLTNGKWADFSGDDKGNDLISLYAAIHGLNQGQAARAIMESLGWQRAQPSSVARAAAVQAPAQGSEEPPPWVDDAPPPEGATTPRPKAKPKSQWRPIVPAPDFAPAPKFVFGYKDETQGGRWVDLDAVRSWEYRRDGQLYGHVARFERINSAGQLVKDTLPLTWCEDESDTRRQQRWHWKQWDAPRPLYLSAGLLAADPRLVPVVLVEGEKCAAAGQLLLGHEFDFVSWPGGAKAWAKADWSWLKGRRVFMWPDADSKRMPLSSAEREANVDPESKPLKPALKQPGMAAMVGIGSILAGQMACEVFVCPIPEPGNIRDGWDIADAIEDGWDAERVRGFIRGARSFDPPDDAVRAQAAVVNPAPADANPDEISHAWRAKLLTSNQGAIRPVRENAVLALDGLPELNLAGDGGAAGVIGFNEFTNDVMKLKPAPWGTPAGVWAEVDELLLGEWLVRAHGLPSMPRGTLEEAVAMVAYRHRYHPVREYLGQLEGSWDGEPRLATWLQRCCIGEGELQGMEEAQREPLQQYLARAGTWFVMGMCQRVLTPGCKFDYMLILEGPQGRRKSTLLASMAGDWFADTGLVLGDKDSYQQLQGKWLYEMGELDAMGKAEITKVKQYIASSKDYFRASFDRRARDYPRQVVFGGTTNEDHYLTDPTGNRRFWPVRVSRVCDVEWMLANRDQLFAEALQRIKDGKRMHPTPREEKELFEPQQQLRQVENAIESALCRYLHNDKDGMLCGELSLIEALGRIGIGVEKLGPGRFHEKQAAAALRRLGWIEGRSSKPTGPNGVRPRVYRRPALGGASPNGSPQSHATERAADACPL